MRSVSWRSTSSADAPGQFVRTTISLNVKSGSSAWPRFRYEPTPIAARTSMV